MAKKRKTQKLGNVIAEMMADKFAEVADDNRFWINKRSKDDKKAPMERVGYGIDIDTLNEEFSDNEFFNLWIDVEDCSQDEQEEMVADVVKKFYGSNYYIGTKFPYTSEDGNKVSFGILKSS